MKLDIKQCARTDVDLMEEIIPSYALSISLHYLCKESGNTVPSAMREVIMQDSAKPLCGLPKARMRKLNQAAALVCTGILKDSQPANSWMEVATAVSLMNLQLFQEEKIKNGMTSTILHSTRIVEEALEEGGWGDTKKSRAACFRMIKNLQEAGYYRTCH